MIKNFKKIPVVSLIIGLTLIVSGIVFVFVFPEVGETIKNVAIGILIVALVVLLVFPDLAKKQTKLVTTLLFLEIIIALFVAIMFIANSGGNPSLWIGLVIYTHGLVDLIGGYFGSNKQKLSRFILAIALVTVGVYIFASGFLNDEMLTYVLLIMFIAPGVFFTTLGIMGLNSKPKKVAEASQ
ncbi:MAG: hypothetical protein ACNA7K_03305 [Acholeplasmataceae bacterium]